MQNNRYQDFWKLQYHKLVAVTLPSGWQQCAEHAKSVRRKRIGFELQEVTQTPIMTLTGAPVLAAVVIVVNIH